MESSALLVNLVIALVAALVGALIAARLGQSVMLGYILAGVAIGPFTPGFTGDPETVEALADLGVILLMFAIGVELSLRELLRVGRVALLGALAQISAMVGVGYLIGAALGWEPLEGILFGAVTAISSAVVFGKLLGDRGESESEHGRIALAWSSVQDLSTIVMVVVLTALAEGGDSLLPSVLWALGKAALFLTLVATLGSVALPWIFDHVAGLRNREVFVLVTAAVALGMAYASSFFGLSLALGAFIAGIVVSESDLSHQVLGEIMPLRDIFAALFFVSVGMLVDPTFALQNLPLVLLALALILLLKPALSAGITKLMGYPTGVALLAGITLAPSAEFSFLLARLGLDLEVVSPGIFNVMLAGAAGSIVLFPLLYRVAGPLTRWVERRLPESPLATHPDLEEGSRKAPRRHAVICGYGRVGSVIGPALERRGFPYVVIEQDPDLVRGLREKGVTALLGSASNPVLLERAGLARARLLLVAVPDPIATRLIVEHALRMNPDVDIAVRTHSWAERDFMVRRRVGKAVMGELEMALELTEYALHRFGVSSTEIRGILLGLRNRVEMERPETLLDITE